MYSTKSKSVIDEIMSGHGFAVCEACKREAPQDVMKAAVVSSNGRSTVEFIYGDSTFPEYMKEGSVKYRFVKDNLGSVRLVVNTSTGVVV